MADEMNIGEKSYVSSKRAAQLSGYVQDYVGQLARKGLIDAQRIGGSWYISMESLLKYKETSESYKPEPPKKEDKIADPESLVHFDGKDYISAVRASKLTGYNQDYIGQLARSGKILSRFVGNRWYIDRQGLLAHKEEKDSLLAAVQVDAVGIQKQDPLMESQLAASSALSEEHKLTYSMCEGDLMPQLEPKVQVVAYPSIEEAKHDESETEEAHPISIRKKLQPLESKPMKQKLYPKNNQRFLIPGKSNKYSIYSKAVYALVIVILLGLVGTAAIVVAGVNVNGSLAAVGNAASSIGGASMEGIISSIEGIVTPELVYRREISQQ